METQQMSALFLRQGIDDCDLDYLKTLLVERLGFEFLTIRNIAEYERFIEMVKGMKSNKSILVTDRINEPNEYDRIKVLLAHGTAVFSIDSALAQKSTIEVSSDVKQYASIGDMIEHLEEMIQLGDLESSNTESAEENNQGEWDSIEFGDNSSDEQLNFVEQDLPFEEDSREEPLLPLTEEEPPQVDTTIATESEGPPQVDMETPVGTTQQHPIDYEQDDPVLSDEQLQKIIRTITEANIINDHAAKGSQQTGILPLPNDKNDKDSSDKKLVYQENPFYARSKNIQRQLFARQQWEDHKMIGVWSPLHRMGVSSFVMNFAFFLAQNRIYTAVLEGLTSQHALKDSLKRFTPVPNNWISYASAIQDNVENPMNAAWNYKDVVFLPLDKKDLQANWHGLSLESYMTTTKIIDVTLVDLPTGEMEQYTKDSLHFLDELWIVIDDATQEVLAWKKYVEELKKQTGIPIHIVFNKEYPFSQTQRIAKDFKMKLLTSIPSLHEETMKNYYEVNPLFFDEDVYQKIEQPFIELGQHLFGSDFTVHEKKRNGVHWKDKLFQSFKMIWQP